MKHTITIVLLICFSLANAQTTTFYKEQYRPQVHFTPPIHWMNDPNGLVYHKGVYHLFYQFNPFGNRWGHMSWGHATSKDLVHWLHLPLAIPEEKDTMIFSGSCVTDINNTAGFAQTKDQQPMVAIYTAHIEGKNQSQHIAYSLDDGLTWTKYKGNPVLDLGKKDFRDPKVFWHDATHQWVMTVVYPIEKEVKLYRSANLKEWSLMSSFGPAGDTSGIWECPDLFEVPIQNQPGQSKWVLMHSPAPYMQYFVGEFDGTKFTNENKVGSILRPDYGPDYYAAVTFNGLPISQKPVSIGWINNWNYANDIPTVPWKSAFSIPRQLSVKQINNEWRLLQQPVEQIKQLRQATTIWNDLQVQQSKTISAKGNSIEIELVFTPTDLTSGIRVAKSKNQYLEIGYDAVKKTVYIDRSKVGNTEFNTAFSKLNHYETVVSLDKNNMLKLHLFWDESIVEVFVNEGEAVLTAQLFPNQKAAGVELFTTGKAVHFKSVKWHSLQSIW